MIHYEILTNNLNTRADIEEAYSYLLSSNNNFLVFHSLNDNSYYILTREKTLFKPDNFDNFIASIANSSFYKTIEVPHRFLIEDKDIDVFNSYLSSFSSEFACTSNGLIFGSIAMRLQNTNAFITTIRGKKDTKDFSIVSKVDHDNLLVFSHCNKPTLNAPLFAHIFENKNVKYIVHFHKINPKYASYPYYIPGTKEDSIRNNKASFNIENHGVIILVNYSESVIT